MMQSILRNKVVFFSCLAAIWTLIILIPKIGKHYREDLNLTKGSSFAAKKNEVNSNIERIEDETTEYSVAGEFRQGDLCLDTLDGKEGFGLGLWQCHGEGRNQFWFLTKGSLNMRNNDLCLRGPKDLKTDTFITLQVCLNEEGQRWIYEKSRVQLSGSSLCLASFDKKVLLEQCGDSESQKWFIKTPPGM